MYNYLDAMKKDIKTALEYDYEIDKEKDRYEIEEELNDEFLCWDSITGNGSGSYTFNSAKAKSYVVDNMDLCIESLKEFCVESEKIAEKFLCEDWEYFDVTIRCYLLGQAISAALDDLGIE